MKVLYEDRDIIVCIKEPGVPTQSDKSRDMDMVNMLRNYENTSGLGGIKVAGVPYIGLVHRLDRPVGGVMVFAKNADALKSLNKQISENKISKNYLAIAMIDNDEKLKAVMQEKDKGIMHDSELDKQALSPWIKIKDNLLKDSKTNLSVIVDSNNRNSKVAELDYRIVGVGSREVEGKSIDTCMLEVYLITGRHHQIRVQMTGQGFPLMGDVKYNEKYNDLLGRAGNRKLVALYSYRLEFLHPRTNKKMEFISMPTHGWFTDNKRDV